MSRSSILSREYLFLISLIAFSLIVRVFPLSMITIISLLAVLFFIAYHFYMYIHLKICEESKEAFPVVYSWGVIAKPTGLISFERFKKYVLENEFNLIKEYLTYNLTYIIFSLFVLLDILVAFKNLNLKNTGAYIALSLFTKFVFLSVYYLNLCFQKNLSVEEKDETKIIDIFNLQMSSYFSLFAVVFIVFFVLSRYIVEIFFGYSFIAFQSSLPFVLLANMSLAIMFCIYLTSVKLNEAVTKKILKVYSVFFSLFFIFMNIEYVDLVAYFILGMSTLFSILLYNFVIKKPNYILSTYNSLF